MIIRYLRYLRRYQGPAKNGRNYGRRNNRPARRNIRAPINYGNVSKHGPNFYRITICWDNEDRRFYLPIDDVLRKIVQPSRILLREFNLVVHHIFDPVDVIVIKMLS